MPGGPQSPGRPCWRAGWSCTAAQCPGHWGFYSCCPCGIELVPLSEAEETKMGENNAWISLAPQKRNFKGCAHPIPTSARPTVNCSSSGPNYCFPGVSQTSLVHSWPPVSPPSNLCLILKYKVIAGQALASKWHLLSPE